MGYPCMLDLETLGTQPDSVIIAIGAVKFGVNDTVETFYQVVDPASCIDVGMKIDASTVMWWVEQGAGARDAFKEKGIPIQEALSLFSAWVDSDQVVWGNGADFDNVILTSAYRLCKQELPWKFYNNRCYRTMKNQFPEVKLVRTGVYHNAVDDANSQAHHLIRILKSIRG